MHFLHKIKNMYIGEVKNINNDSDNLVEWDEHKLKQELKNNSNVTGRNFEQFLIINDILESSKNEVLRKISLWILTVVILSFILSIIAIFIRLNG